MIGKNEMKKRERIKDTFAARSLQIPEKRSTNNDIRRYTSKDGYGLELRKRRHNHQKPTII